MSVAVAYFGRRFAGPLVAERFRAGLEEIGHHCPRIETSIGRFGWRLAWRRLRRRPLPRVVSVMVHPGLLPLWLLIPRSKRLYVIHDTTPHPGWRWKLIGSLDKALASMSGAVIALSDHSATDWRRRSPPGQPVTVVPLPPIAGPEAAARPRRPGELGAMTRPFVLLFGRTDGYKGVEELWPHLEPWLASSGWDLVIAGVDCARLTSLVGPEVPPSVRFVSRYLAEDEIDWLVTCDCVLLLPYTSATQSGVMERFAAGASVPLGFAVGGLGQQLRSLHPACAVDAGDYRAFMARLATLTSDAGLRQAVRAAKAGRSQELQRRFVAALSEVLPLDPYALRPDPVGPPLGAGRR